MLFLICCDHENSSKLELTTLGRKINW